VWSKAGWFVEGLHVVGDILTKISVNCVINLCDALLVTCLFLWVFSVYVACLHHCYLSMNSCIYVMYLSIYVLCIRFRKSYVCVYFQLHAVQKSYVA
jgi:hypothetical protein